MKGFARIKQVVAGSYVSPDGGFTCLRAGILRKVRADAEGELYIKCEDGKHFLDGQIGLHEYNRDRYVGLYLRGKRA